MTTKKRYAERNATGKCVNCGKEKSGEYKYCENCRNRGRERYKRDFGKIRPDKLICKTCQEEFDVIKKFGPLPFYCQKCRKEHNSYFLKRWSQDPKNKPAIRVYRREYARKWRATRHHIYLDTTLRRKYHINLESYVQIYDKQDGRCAICKKSLPPWDVVGKKRNKIHLDHDHKTNKIRGILCDKCNLAIGLFEDSSEVVASALWYLSSF